MSLPCWSRAKASRGFALDHGFATAEFAIVLPAVVFVLAFIMWVLSLFITQLQIQSASYSIARNIARGEIGINDTQSQFPAEYKIQKIVANNFVTVKVDVQKSLLNQRVPWAVELSAVAVSEMERLSVDNGN